MNQAKRHLWTVLLLILVILLLLLLLFKCCHRPRPVPPATTNTGTSPAAKVNATVAAGQLIIWKDPASTDRDFSGWLQSFKATLLSYGPITDSSVCLSCDSTLIKLSGPGPSLWGEQQLAGGNGGTGTKGVGHSGPAYYCMDQTIAIPEQVFLKTVLLKESPRPAIPAGSAPAGAKMVTVAVFDTGIDSLLRSQYVHASTPACMIGSKGQYGWNFISNTDNTLDDDSDQHGSLVTKFIIEQAQLYSPGTVNILPVKVLDKDGKGDLYNFLCAISYAANSGAKVFNASLGFYAYPDSLSAQPAIALFQNFLHYYLTRDHIILIAAAGNQVPGEDSAFLRRRAGATAASARDLDSNPFYPASFASASDPNFNHVFTVTTLSLVQGKVSPLQNFSNKVVDIGVNCDAVLKETFPNKTVVQEYLFANIAKSGSTPFTSVTGSSFAAPIITGRMAASYYTFPGSAADASGTDLNKGGILKLMQTEDPQVKADPASLANLRNQPFPTQQPNPMLLAKRAFSGAIRNGLVAYRY